LNFDSLRRIRFSFQNFSINDTALGDTDGSQLAFAAGAGYHLQSGGFTFTPNANIRYAKTDIDGYTETNAGANNTVFEDQSIKSLQTSLGIQVSKPISLSRGVLAPQFDLSLVNESRDSNYTLNARLVSVNANQGFVVRSEDPDTSFGNVGLGLVYVTSNGKQAYFNYRKLFGSDQIERDTFSLGARFEF
jgi:outer membrane autotransporter protein